MRVRPAHPQHGKYMPFLWQAFLWVGFAIQLHNFRNAVVEEHDPLLAYFAVLTSLVFVVAAVFMFFDKGIACRLWDHAEEVQLRKGHTTVTVGASRTNTIRGVARGMVMDGWHPVRIRCQRCGVEERREQVMVDYVMGQS